MTPEMTELVQRITRLAREPKDRSQKIGSLITKFSDRRFAEGQELSKTYYEDRIELERRKARPGYDPWDD